MSDKTLRVTLCIIFSVFAVWVSFQFGYMHGYTDACKWCSEMYQEN